MIRKIFNREFILGFFALFAVASVFHILIPTLPIYLSRLGSTEEEIGVLIGIFGFSSLVVRPFVGRALRRLPEKDFMMAGGLLHALTSVLYLFAPPFWPFLIVRTFQGIGFASFHTASLTFAANISSGSHRGQSISYFVLSFSIAGALAPSLGVFLINRFSFNFLFLVCFGLSLGSFFITFLLGKKQAPVSQDSVKESRFFLTRNALPPSILGGCAFMMWGAVSAFFPIYAIDQGVTNPGHFFATIAIVLILGRAFGGRIVDVYPREKIILPCLITYLIPPVILAFSGTQPMFLLAAVIWGIGHAFLMPALVVYALEGAGSSAGPAMGTFHAMTDLGTCLGPAIMGVVLTLTGYRIMFLCCALTAALNLGYFCFLVRKKSD